MVLLQLLDVLEQSREVIECIDCVELRRESVPMPVFALVLAKSGPEKLAPTRSTATRA
jgi:hypothetical protein